MILFWGSKGYQKIWDIRKLRSNVVTVTMSTLGRS